MLGTLKIQHKLKITNHINIQILNPKHTNNKIIKPALCSLCYYQKKSTTSVFIAQIYTKSAFNSTTGIAVINDNFNSVSKFTCKPFVLSDKLYEYGIHN